MTRDEYRNKISSTIEYAEMIFEIEGDRTERGRLDRITDELLKVISHPNYAEEGYDWVYVGSGGSSDSKMVSYSLKKRS